MTFNTARFINEQIETIKKKVGNKIALCATSGGVDSMVCAALAHRALGRRLIALFIDDGLMRENEPEQVTTILLYRNLKNSYTMVMKFFIIVKKNHKIFRGG